jgi:GntR family transcriptional regulator
MLQDVLRLRGDTAQPLYQQLEDQIAGLIAAGTLAVGTTLPAERQLAKDLAISRVTVQRCYNALRQRKLVGAFGRLGSIVQGPGGRLSTGMDRLKGFTEEMRELGREPSSRILEQHIGPDRPMASLFGVSSDATFLKLVRVRCGDGVPMSREVAWYNLVLAPNLPTRDLSQSIYSLLREAGVPLVRAEQTIEAATPNAEECETFNFTTPVPCLLIKRRSYAAGQVMAEYVEGLFRGDAYSYRLSLKV